MAASDREKPTPPGYVENISAHLVLARVHRIHLENAERPLQVVRLGEGHVVVFCQVSLQISAWVAMVLWSTSEKKASDLAIPVSRRAWMQHIVAETG